MFVIRGGGGGGAPAGEEVAAYLLKDRAWHDTGRGNPGDP